MRAEVALWPHQPGIERVSKAAPDRQRLTESLDHVLKAHGTSLLDVAKGLGATVVIAPIKRPREGWTWFRKRGPLIEVADWLSRERRDLVLAHELCHVVLGPPPDQHDQLTERICNWGAGRLVAHVGLAG